MAKQVTADQFQKAQLGLASVLAHPEFGTVLQKLTQPENKMAVGSDLLPFMNSSKMSVPANIKAQLQETIGGPPMVRICWVIDPAFPGDPIQGTICIGVHNPFEVTVS